MRTNHNITDDTEIIGPDDRSGNDINDIKGMESYIRKGIRFMKSVIDKENGKILFEKIKNPNIHGSSYYVINTFNDNNVHQKKIYIDVSEYGPRYGTYQNFLDDKFFRLPTVDELKELVKYKDNMTNIFRKGNYVSDINAVYWTSTPSDTDKNKVKCVDINGNIIDKDKNTKNFAILVMTVDAIHR